MQESLRATKTASSQTDEAVIRPLNFIRRKRTMRKFIRASVLVLALAIPAFAGEMPCGVTGDIPNNVTGNIPNGDTTTGYIPNGVAGEIPNNVTGDIPYGVTSQIPYGITGNIPYSDTSQTSVINFLLSLLSLI
jgi:hypothetical protein